MTNRKVIRLLILFTALLLLPICLYAGLRDRQEPTLCGDLPSFPSTASSSAASDPTDPTVPTLPTQLPEPTQPQTQPTFPPETQVSLPAETLPTIPPETQIPTTMPESLPLDTEPSQPESLPPPETEPAATQPSEPAPGKIIYLTFDDGPGKDTLELLAILDKYQVKVTFFVLGTSELEYLDDIANAGHAIGIHSNSHRFNEIYASADGFWQDFTAIDDLIYQSTGIRTKLYRFPGGSSNVASKKYCKGIMTELVRQVEEKGYRYFDWNVDCNDTGNAKTAQQVYENVISAVKNKDVSVVLMHDVKPYTVDAVEDILIWGLENGYTFLPLDENSPGAHHNVRN